MYLKDANDRERHSPNGRRKEQQGHDGHEAARRGATVGRRARSEKRAVTVAIENQQVQARRQHEDRGLEREPFERRQRRLLLHQAVAAETRGERQPDPRQRAIREREPQHTRERERDGEPLHRAAERSRKTTTPISTFTSGVMK